MYPLPITSDLNTLTTEYFSRHPSEWDSQSYLANILKRHPALEPAEVNSRFYTALRKIVASASSSSVAIARAQLLIDQVKQRLRRSVCIPPRLFDLSLGCYCGLPSSAAQCQQRPSACPTA